MLWIRCCRFRRGRLMGKKKKAEKIKLTFWQTVQVSRGLYGRLFRYVKPYKWRFITGLLFGLAFGAVNSTLPWIMMQVSTFIFHGAMPSLKMLTKHQEMLATGPQINSIILICLLIPLVMTLRSVFSYASAYCVSWVSNRVVVDIRNELFGKLVRHSMDFFNRMR